MMKPQLPKRWPRRINGLSTFNNDLSLAYWQHGGKASSIALYVGRLGINEIQVLILSGSNGRGVKPTRKIVRAVELAAIHAGLVEDREP